MSDSVKQEIEGTTNSTINQANGDITINNVSGISACEVVQICTSVIQTQMDIYTQQAAISAKERFDIFCGQFTSRLESVETKIAEQLKEPSVQIALHESIKGSIEGNDNELTEDLIDLMIERMSIMDKCAEQFIIDEARKTLPKLTRKHLAFLALKTFTRLLLGESRRNLSEILFSKLLPALSHIASFSKLDLNYIAQIGCVGNPMLLINDKSVEQILLNSYDLYFKKNCTVDDFNCVNSVVQPTITDTIIIVQFLEMNDNEISFSLTRSNILCNLDSSLTKVNNFITELSKKCTSYNEEEVHNHLISGNPLWDTALQILNSIGKDAFLSPLGEYLGLRYLSKMLGRKIPLNLFYSK